MSQLPKDKAGPLARYVATIQSQRGDYNGRVLSIRQEDLRSLAVIYDKTPTDLTEELINWGILDSTPAEPSRPSEPGQQPAAPSTSTSPPRLDACF